MSRTASSALSLFLLLLCTAVPLRATAQTGTISGRVTAASVGSPLPQATVAIENTSLRTLTDVDGSFVLQRVPAGSLNLVVSYVGYAESSLPVQVRSAGTTTVDIELSERAIELNEIVVYGEATRGQAKALQKQKTSLTITNVVSEELFNRFPDRNAAETVRRLPGISVDRDQGEGEFVQIRGIDQEYNSLTVNGVRIPAPDEADGIRSVGLDLINNRLLGEVEVVKALTPDMDADAVGGVVNFGLRSAPSGGVGTLGLGFGLNNQTSDFETYGRDIQDFAAVLGNRYSDDRLGVLIDGAYYKTARHSKLRELEYDDDDGILDEVILAQHTNDYDVKRQRFGFGSTVDYRFTPASQLYLTGSYNVYLDDEVRRLADFNIDDEEETRETRNRLEDQRVALLIAGGEHRLGTVDVEWKGAWIRATEELPDRTYLRYRRDNPFTGFSNDEIKEFDGTTTFTGLDAPELDRIRRDDMLKDDRDLSGRLDLTIPFALTGSTSRFKVGGKVLRKNVSFERVRYQMTDFTSTQTIAEGTFGFEDVRWDDAPLQPVLTDWGSERNTTDDYDANETIAAAYAMTVIELSPSITLLGGGRYEKTSTDYAQPNPETHSAPLTGEGGYDNFLPSLHLTVRPDASSNIRAAYTTGLARPRYQQLVPRRVVDDDERTISYGNPDLEPRTAHNFDLMYERFTSRLGVITLGAFYKRFNAFHTTRRFIEEVNGVPYDATQTVMGDGTASYFGIELGFNQRLAFLGSALRDFSLFGTYNYTRSEGEVDGREIPLTNSPRHTGNLSVLYDNAGNGLSFVVAGNYRDAMLISVGGNEFRDVYFDEEFHLDVSVAKSISRQLSVSAQVNGLTGRQEREILGSPGSSAERLLQWEEYGPYGTVSLRYTFR